MKANSHRSALMKRHFTGPFSRGSVRHAFPADRSPPLGSAPLGAVEEMRSLLRASLWKPAHTVRATLHSPTCKSCGLRRLWSVLAATWVKEQLDFAPCLTAIFLECQADAVSKGRGKREAQLQNQILSLQSKRVNSSGHDFKAIGIDAGPAFMM